MGKRKFRVTAAHDAERPPLGGLPDHLVESVFAGLELSGVSFCLCDQDDVIQFASPAFHASFLSCWDGTPIDFTQCLTASFVAGRGVKLESMTLESFKVGIRARRREMTGSVSFSADTLDGKWWRVTDVKLANGWLVAVAHDISSLKHEELKLRDAHASAVSEAQTDFLTGAPNRRHGLQRAQALFDACRASGRILCAVLLDLDHFKSINDIYGHDAGDLALVHFARLMLGVLGPGDQFSRVGGEEFLLVSDHQDLSYIERLLCRVVYPLERLMLPSGESLALTASAGIAASCPKETWRGLLHRADMALYQAKANGRDRIEHAIPGP